MKLSRAPLSTCVARLGKGEVKRIPVVVGRPLVGYYVGCPSCGRVQPIPTCEQAFEEAEDASGAPTLTMGPGSECTKCHATFRFERDEITVILSAG